ncbi:MAG TPA: FtsX-like permease family protein [Methanobacterium sp.]|nr:FtsX-like permease family protein [Methanobacterium sp.]
MSIYKLSFKNFKRRKLRSALTMLGVIIGVTALIVLVGLSTGMTSYLNDGMKNMMGDVMIYNNSSVDTSNNLPSMDQNTVSKIKNMSQLYDVKEQISLNTDVNGITIPVSGVSDWSTMTINGTPGVVLLKDFANQFNYKIGSNITIKGQQFTVTGITASNMGSMSGSAVFINADKALSMNNNKVTMITARTKEDPNSTKNQIQSNNKGIVAITTTDMSKQIDDFMKMVSIFVGAIASIALLVGVISIINIMLVNVTERTREIGVLKAIGFTNREILGSILAESGFIGLIGAIIAVIISAVLLEIALIVIVPILNSQMQMTGSVSLIQMMPLWLIAGVIIGSTLLSILAGLYPAWRASRLNVVEALRYE